MLQVRAKTFYAEKKGLNVADVDVPVIGGHAGITILPLFSQASPHAQLSDEETDQLTKRTQDGGTEVVTAKAGKVIFTPQTQSILWPFRFVHRHNHSHINTHNSTGQCELPMLTSKQMWVTLGKIMQCWVDAKAMQFGLCFVTWLAVLKLK